MLSQIGPLDHKQADELIFLLTAPLEKLFPEKSPEELAEYALAQYTNFYKHQAPRWFREKYGPEPSLEALLEAGYLRSWWPEEKREELTKALQAKLEP